MEKENRDGKRAEVEPYEMPFRTSEEISVERDEAREALAMIREKLGIKKTPEHEPKSIEQAFVDRVVQAIKDGGQNVTSIDLGHLRTTATHCRCGVVLKEPRGKAWVGITNPPKLCKPCGEIPQTCTCQPIQNPQPKRTITREPEVFEKPIDSPGDEDVPF